MLNIESFFGMLFVNAWLRLIRLKWRGASVGRRSWLKCGVSIGKGTATGSGLSIRGAGRLSIGRYCAIGESVRIITSNHDMKYLSINFLVQDRLVGRRLVASKTDVRIGNDVWIGDGAIILAGVSIGDGSVIGAGSVVTHSIPPFKVAAGNPARIIKDRFPSGVADKVAALAWWNWSETELKRNAHWFSVYCESSDALAGIPDSVGADHDS